MSDPPVIGDYDAWDSSLVGGSVGDNTTTTASELPSGAIFENDTLTWTPGFDQAGTYTLVFTATDGILETTLQVQVSVDNVARPLAISSFRQVFVRCRF